MKKKKSDLTYLLSGKGVPDKVLIDSLVAWPKGTVGYYKEVEVVKILNDLCKEHGYGRIPQLAEFIELIWNDKNKAEIFKTENDKRNAELSEFFKNDRK